jgi:hypothetical protein
MFVQNKRSDFQRLTFPSIVKLLTRGENSLRNEGSRITRQLKIAAKGAAGLANSARLLLRRYVQELSMIKQILYKLGLCQEQNNGFQEIEYSATGTPEENSQKLIEAVTFGNEWIRKRSQSDYEQIGAFFTVVLLIEHKLVDLLSSFDPQISNKMLGRKIDTFKEFLKAFEFSEKDEREHYRSLISPLKVLKNIRDAMAHDIKRSKITPKDLSELTACLEKNREDLHGNIELADNDQDKVFLIITSFGFYISQEIAKLKVKIE